MKKIITLILAFGALSVTAQELNRQVEVTKSYTPEPRSAAKLSLSPQMEDSVPMRPEEHYEIISAQWQTDFGMAPIPAAGVDARLTDRQPKLTLRAGGGHPLRSTIDAWFHSEFIGGYGGAWLNHRGRYADLDNDFGEATDALSTTNTLGGYLYTKLAGSTGLKLEANGSWDYFTRYGQAPAPNMIPELQLPGTPSIQSYGQAGARLSIGNDFGETDHFTYRLSVGANTLNDRSDNGQEELQTRLALGYRIGANRIGLEGWWEIYNGLGGDDLSYYKQKMWGVRPTYSFVHNRFNILLGVAVTSDERPDDYQGALILFPRVQVRWDLASGWFIPFFDVDGRMENNGLRNLMARNPYMISGQVEEEYTAIWEGSAGISGSFSGAFAYKLYGAWTLWRDRVYFAYDYDRQAAAFALGRQDAVQWAIGAELSARIAGNLELLASGRKNFNETLGQSSDDGCGNTIEQVFELPDWQAGLELRYTLHDHFSIAAGIDAIGPRWFAPNNWCYEVDNGVSYPQVKTQLDLHLRADVRIDNRWGVWAEGRNLLGKPLYPYHHYRLPRTISLGVSLKL